MLYTHPRPGESQGCFFQPTLSNPSRPCFSCKSSHCGCVCTLLRFRPWRSVLLYSRRDTLDKADSGSRSSSSFQIHVLDPSLLFLYPFIFFSPTPPPSLFPLLLLPVHNFLRLLRTNRPICTSILPLQSQSSAFNLNKIFLLRWNPAPNYKASSN
jgi:hypothetical protein